jgi:hypothetical protein
MLGVTVGTSERADKGFAGFKSASRASGRARLAMHGRPNTILRAAPEYHDEERKTPSKRNGEVAPPEGSKKQGREGRIKIWKIGMKSGRLTEAPLPWSAFGCSVHAEGGRSLRESAF